MSTTVDSSSIDTVIEEARELLRRDPHSSISLMRTVVVNRLAEPHQSVAAHLVLSRGHIHIGEYGAGEPIARNALSKAREHGLRREEGLAHNEVGVYRFVAGDYAAALNHYEAAEHLLIEAKDDESLARVFVNVGNVYNRSDKQVRAITFYEKALLLAKRASDELTTAKVHSNLAGLYFHVVYDPALAADHVTKAIEIYRSLDDKVGLAKALVNRGIHNIQLLKFEEALEDFEESLVIRESFSEPDDYRMTYDGLVLALLSLERIDEAEARAEEVERMFDGEGQLGDPHLKVMHARIQYAKGNPGASAEILRGVLADPDLLKDNQELRNTCRELLARSAMSSGEYEEAASLAFEIMEIQRQQNKVQALHSLARIKVELDLAKAEARTEAARIRNHELARMIADLESVHKENEEYVAVLAHELKSPLSTIRSLAGMLSSNEDLTVEEHQGFNREIHAISTRMFDLISSTLSEASKRTRSLPTPIDASPVWSYVLTSADTAASAKGVTLRWSISDKPLPISASEQQLALILENLVSNAIKFSVPGTTVNATVIHQSYGVGADRAIIRVKDQGPGVSEEEQTRLFTAFEQLSAVPTGDEVSTGLGLHLVKKTVDQLNGRVWCESVLGKGATFFVELPLQGPKEK